MTVALLVVLTLVTTLARQMRTQLWQRYVNYASPFLGELPSGAPRQPLAQRVVVVLVRGLRLDESRQMPALNALRARGADVTIESRPPTYRLAATFTWLSGAWPETHGATTNSALLLARPDTILRAVQASDKATAFVGSDQLSDLLGAALQRVELVDDLEPAQRDQQAIELALDVLNDPARPPQFVLVELSLLEEVARSDPESYRAAIAATDFRIGAIGNALNPSAAALVVLSDRGLTYDGRDGGGEAGVTRTPLVLTGAGVVPGTQAIAPATAIAPTLAALAGAPIPTHAQGGPILAALVPAPALPIASAQQLTAFYEQWSAAMGQPRFASELLRRYEDRLAADDAASYAAWFAELDQAVERAMTERLTTERAARLPFAAGVTLLLLAIAGLILNAHFIRPLAGTIAYVAAWSALFFVARGGSFSLSLFPDGDPATTFGEWERISGALMGLIGLAIAFTTGACEDVFEAIAATLSALGLIALVQLLAFIGFYWQWGDVFTWTLPESSAFTAALLALTQLAGLSMQATPDLPELPLAPLVAIATAVIYVLVRRPSA
ncbi:MAG: hypothetical protein RMN52_12035 [Anaerolineae bacterium]|nr:hypothetical protein [Candidatus Roseilinea sp.]MDW8450720.1 hypothetical protein [Anaerolineae bacterium]